MFLIIITKFQLSFKCTLRHCYLIVYNKEYCTKNSALIVLQIYAI